MKEERKAVALKAADLKAARAEEARLEAEEEAARLKQQQEEEEEEALRLEAEAEEASGFEEGDGTLEQDQDLLVEDDDFLDPDLSFQVWNNVRIHAALGVVVSPQCV